MSLYRHHLISYLKEFSMVKIPVAKLEEVISMLSVVQGKVYIFGNGGSASTASHFAGDLNKNCSKFQGIAICLNDNMTEVSAIANDDSYSNIFVSQLDKKLKTGDVVIAFSGSGRSMNILKALDFAKKYAYSVAILGYDGGEAKDLTDISVVVPSYRMQICEDIHLMMCHMIISALNGGTENE